MNDVIIIYMDDFSQEALDINRQTLWDRSLHADLLAYLKSDRAKAVVFDIIFSDPGPNSSADRKLAEAIKAHGKVILGAASVRQPNLPEGPVRVLLPYDLFLDSAAGLGLTQLPVDPDVVVRQNFLESTNLVASLAYAAAELLDSVAAKAARSGSAQSWLNYYGPPGSIPFVSYFKVFRTNQSFRLPPGFFRDKVVFVGRKESGGLISRPLGSPVERHDEFASPYILRASDAFFPGVELQATAFLNLIHKNWLTRLPTFSECLVLGLTGIIFGLGLARCRPAATIPFAILGIFGVGASAYLLFVHRLMWFPWLIIVAGQIPVAGAWSVIYRLRKRHR